MPRGNLNEFGGLVWSDLRIFPWKTPFHDPALRCQSKTMKIPCSDLRQVCGGFGQPQLLAAPFESSTRQYPGPAADSPALNCRPAGGRFALISSQKSSPKV